MRVEVFTAVSAFQDLRAEWYQLLSQLPFQSVGGVTLARPGHYTC